MQVTSLLWTRNSTRFRGLVEDSLRLCKMGGGPHLSLVLLPEEPAQGPGQARVGRAAGDGKWETARAVARDDSVHFDFKVDLVAPLAVKSQSKARRTLEGMGRSCGRPPLHQRTGGAL